MYPKDKVCARMLLPASAAKARPPPPCGLLHRRLHGGLLQCRRLKSVLELLFLRGSTRVDRCSMRLGHFTVQRAIAVTRRCLNSLLAALRPAAANSPPPCPPPTAAPLATAPAEEKWSRTVRDGTSNAAATEHTQTHAAPLTPFAHRVIQADQQHEVQEAVEAQQTAALRGAGQSTQRSYCRFRGKHRQCCACNLQRREGRSCALGGSACNKFSMHSNAAVRSHAPASPRGPVPGRPRLPAGGRSAPLARRPARGGWPALGHAWHAPAGRAGTGKH